MSGKRSFSDLLGAYGRNVRQRSPWAADATPPPVDADRREDEEVDLLIDSEDLAGDGEAGTPQGEVQPPIRATFSPDHQPDDQAGQPGQSSSSASGQPLAATPQVADSLETRHQVRTWRLLTLAEQLSRPQPNTDLAVIAAAREYAKHRSDACSVIWRSFEAEGSPVITTGEHPADLDPLYDPDYKSEFHWQQTPDDTGRLVSYLFSGAYESCIFRQVPIGGSDEWDRFILGVRSLDREREYSWMLFRDLYPCSFPAEVIAFVKLPRPWVEDALGAVLAEKEFLEGLGRTSWEYKCFYRRICYLLSKASASRVQAQQGARSRTLSAARGPPLPPRAPPVYPMVGSGSASGSAFTPILGSQPLSLVPFPVESLVSEISLQTISTVWDRLRAHRNQGGQVPRRAVFEDRAWNRLQLHFGDQWVDSITWEDTRWFQHLLNSIKGERLSDGKAGDEVELTVQSLVETYCPLRFHNFNKFFEDMDAFLAGLQQVNEQLELKGIREFDQATWGKVVKRVLNGLRSHGKAVQLPAEWERLCSGAQNMLLASKTRRRFASFYEAFAFFLKEDFNLLGTMRAKWDVDLSSLRPNAAGEAQTTSQQQSRQATSASSNLQKKPGFGKPPGGSAAAGSGRQSTALPQQQAEESSSAGTQEGGFKGQCGGCGLFNKHPKETCPHRGHVNWNRSDMPWPDSYVGKFFKSHGYSALPFRDPSITIESLKGKPKTKYAGSSSGGGKPGGKISDPLVSGPTVSAVGTLSPLADISYLVSGFVSFNRGSWPQVKVSVFFDTGALLGERFLVGSHVLTLIDSPTRKEACLSCVPVDICSPVVGLGRGTPLCSKCETSCFVSVILPDFGEGGVTVVIPEGEALVLEMEYDLIIGLEAIMEYDLLPPYRDFLLKQRLLSASGDAPSTSCSQLTSGSRPLVSSLHLVGSNSPEADELVLPLEHFFGSLTLAPDGTESLLGISDFLPQGDSTLESALSELPTMAGDSDFHLRIRDLCLEFRDIFSRTVTETPARVDSFTLNVDKEQWQTKAHTRGPRPQPPTRNAEISRQVKQMLDLGVIRRAENVGHYSQVLLAPKPHSTAWRFCIDYRILNALTVVNSGYPLPHIPSMMDRLGQKRPKWLGKMDFVSGYHQCLLDPASAEFAAFVTAEGVFVPVRVPFGLKAAPSYFHGQMATNVLGSHLHEICELFMDDVISWGRDDEEYLSGLRKIFARFREKNIKVHPDKCVLGVPKLEFVGHVIDVNGLTMSEEKIRKVLDFALPANTKELRSFVGLCNYFSEHIPGCSVLLRPLHNSIKRHSAGKSKRKAAQTPLEWSVEEEEAFGLVKRAIEACATLYFLDDDGLVYLATDASDYGIGAYLYQIVDGKERPVRFMSHSLSEAECRWSTIEKECYAIFRAFTEFAFLIRDRKFLLLTDHRNLVFLSNPSGSKATSEKVIRWRLAIQEFNCDVQHIAGIHNVAPDSFSRLVPRLYKFEQLGVTTPGATARNELTVSMLAVSAARQAQPRIVPQEARQTIGAFHNELVGHFGVDRTLAMLKEAGHSWHGMRKHVRLFCSECPLCQKLSYVRPANVATPFTTGGGMRPMDRWCVDTLEAVETEGGYKFVLAFLDCFTRWVELYPVKSLGAEEAAECLVNIIGRYGAPRELLSDRGSQFVNGIISAVLRTVGTNHSLAMAYSHEENGRIERANREILRHLRAFVMHSKVADDWVKKLPFVQRIMNASVHTVTGFSPAALLFGKAVDLNRSIFPEGSSNTSEKGSESTLPTAGVDVSSEFFSAWVDQRNKMQLEVLQASAELQQAELERHLQSVSPDKVTTFANGTWVLVLPHNNPLSGRRRSGDKLSGFWEGPMRVVSHEGNAYTLHDTVEDKHVNRHVMELKPFLFDPLYTKPEEVARIDRREFLIERIVERRGDVSRKGSLWFRVRWAGYSEAYDLWLPWRSVLHTAQLRQYLDEQGLLRLLPRSAR